MGQSERPLSLKSMAKGPEGSNRVVVAANDGKIVKDAYTRHQAEPLPSPALRILAITSPLPPSISGKPVSSSPLAQEEASTKSGFTSASGPKAIAHGAGGARIEEVVNLWKGVPTGSVAKVVNHVDWGVGSEFMEIPFPPKFGAVTDQRASHVQQDSDRL